jgi:tRNA threonylcarbamoyladenosine biosynthesis protein TsaB
MTTLVIETATAACSVALLDGAVVRAAAHEIVGRGHAERLVPMIGEVLTSAGVKRAELILVDCGPGSFTGIRVGLAAARALALAWQVEVAGYSALALIAATAPGGEIGVAIAGGHGEVFVQRFSLPPLTAITAMRSLPPAEAGLEISDDLVLGSGAPALVSARGHGHAEERFPNAADAILLPAGLAGLLPTPLYGRPPDAALPR